MLDARLQELLDWKEILELKARYFWTFDDKDWVGFRAVFADDCSFDFGGGSIVHGPDTFIALVTEQPAVSVHRGCLPEIEFRSSTEAHGVWQLNDFIEWPADPETGERSGYVGCGREIEDYRKIDGEWKIATWRIMYTRIDPLPREPLPTSFLGGPDGLRDEAYLAGLTQKA